MHVKLVTAAHLFLIKDGKILLIRRFKTGYEDGSYSVIAGHVDGNETIRHAIAREAIEEAGIEISLNDLEVVHVMHRKSSQERIDFFLKADKWKGEPKNMEPDKCDQIMWYCIGKLPDNVIPYLRQGIDCFRKKKFYSEFGWD